jgi:hypothetical protein
MLALARLHGQVAGRFELCLGGVHIGSAAVGGGGSGVFLDLNCCTAFGVFGDEDADPFEDAIRPVPLWQETREQNAMRTTAIFFTAWRL